LDLKLAIAGIGGLGHDASIIWVKAANKILLDIGFDMRIEFALEIGFNIRLATTRVDVTHDLSQKC
jgi:hypothetical protein